MAAAGTAATAARRRSRPGDALVLEGVTRALRRAAAIDDVSLSVAAGERRAVIGANGAGKTTLFNAITGDFPPTAGACCSSARTSPRCRPHERIRMGLRRTYQSSLLFRDLTVRDNLFLAVRGVSRGRFSFLRAARAHTSRAATQDLLERVRLTHVADAAGGRRCRTASSASSRSAWRWPARRG